MASLNAITAAYEALPQTSATADAASLLAFIKGRSEFTASGLSRDNSVWARYTDGTTLCIMLSEDPLAAAGKAAPLLLPSLTRSAGFPVELPASSNVYLINVAGTGADSMAPLTAIQTNIFGPGQYSAITLAGTLENLKNLNHIGVLYVIGHAGIATLPGTPDENPTYIMNTLTPVSSASDAAYHDDFSKGMVTYDLIPTANNGSPSKRTLSPTYGITDRFVLANWQFSNNSLFVNDTSAGAGAEAAAFRSTLFGAGLSVYLGWNGPVSRAAAAESSGYLFTEIAGTAASSVSAAPQTPPVRAFDFQNVLGLMATMPRTTAGATAGDTLASFSSSGSYDRDVYKAGESHFKDFESDIPAQANFGLLTPSISGARIDEVNHRLTLMGTFGSAAGQVLISGTDFSDVTTWTPTQITVDNLPITGTGSNGDILVRIRGRASNVVHITEWRGTLLARQVLNGSETVLSKYQMHFRGILDNLRSSPIDPPLPNMNGIVDSVYDDSSCTWDASGSSTSGTVTETVSRVGSPALPLSNTNIVLGLPGRAASLGMSFDFSTTPPNMRFSVYAYDNDSGGLQKMTVDSSSGATNSFTLPMFVNFSSDLVAGPDSSFNIPAGHWTSADGSQSISWQAMSAVSPPADYPGGVSRSAPAHSNRGTLPH
ncbi:MAG TPA: hypothetical protein VKT77_22715 [Chthonomonadaceae bacterium]|nr:hypothetical protein [Chthonomonadaceae bacterium]